MDDEEEKLMWFTIGKLDEPLPTEDECEECRDEFNTIKEYRKKLEEEFKKAKNSDEWIPLEDIL